MKTIIMAVKDTKLGKMCQPFFVQNEAIAGRMIQATVREEGNQLHDFPEDFQVFKLGTFDEETGEITSKVEFVKNVTEYIKKENK